MPAQCTACHVTVDVPAVPRLPEKGWAPLNPFRQRHDDSALLCPSCAAALRAPLPGAGGIALDGHDPAHSRPAPAFAATGAPEES